MAPRSHQLLIISRNTLLRLEKAPEGPFVFRQLANLTRQGAHLILTAPEPDRWFPTRGTEDNVLGAQGMLQQLIQECGGDLDGVYYVPRSLFTQDRNRLGALKDILKRYSSKADNAYLISASTPFLKAAGKLGINTRTISKGDNSALELKAALDTLS